MSVARLQRAVVFVLLAVAAVWAVVALAHDEPAWAVAGVLMPMVGLGAVLGVEFVLLRAVNRGDPAPPASVSELMRAWLGETWTALVVFGWRQPFRSRAEPDHLPPDARGRRGVLLVHGFICNRGLWNPWLRRLRAANVPCVAVDLEPVFGRIEQYAAIVDEGVRRLTEATGVPPLLVGHSMGGLAIRAWLAQYGGHDRAHAVVTVGTPHGGTWIARFAYSANGRQMRLGGAWLRDLRGREEAVGSARPPFTCYYGHCDNIVFPASTATRRGADNRHLRGVAHVRMIYEDAVLDDVLHRLSPSASARDGTAPGSG